MVDRRQAASGQVRRSGRLQPNTGEGAPPPEPPSGGQLDFSDADNSAWFLVIF